MKEFKGTPGLWHYDDELGGIYSKGGQFVCDVTDKNNANLIAAAPELLEALRDLESRACIYVNTSKAKSAINKALGEKQ